MQVVHRRVNAETRVTVAWLSDRTRPFAIVFSNLKYITLAQLCTLYL